MSSDWCDVLLLWSDVTWPVQRSVGWIWCHLTGVTFCFGIWCHLTGVTFCFWIWCHLDDPFSDTRKPCPTFCLHEHLKLFNYFANPSTRPKDDFVLWKGRNLLFQSRLNVSSENLLAYFLRISLWDPLLSLRSRQIAKLLHINCLYRYLSQAEQKNIQKKSSVQITLLQLDRQWLQSIKENHYSPSISLSLLPPSLPTSFFVLRTSCTPSNSYIRRIEMEKPTAGR